MTYPTLRQLVEAVLLDAGFRPYSDLPTRNSGGTFDLIHGAGLEVHVQWWDVTDEEKRSLLERFADALVEAGFDVEDRGDRMYVAAAD